MSTFTLHASEPGSGKPQGKDCVFTAVHPTGAWTRPEGLTLTGLHLRGGYREVLRALQTPPSDATGLIVLFRKGDGVSTFLSSLPEALRALPTAGGVAAWTDPEAGGFLSPGKGLVHALVLTGQPWRLRRPTLQTAVGPVVYISAQRGRHIAEVSIRGRSLPARDWMESLFSQLHLQRSPWEHVGLRTKNGIVLHASPEGDGIHCGADLPPGGQLTPVAFDPEACAETLSGLAKGSLVFGCAGLHAVMPAERAWEEHACAYLYGEVIPSPKGPAFANLSLTVLEPHPA